MKLPSKVITIHHNPVSQPGITTRAARHHDLLLVKISRHLSHYSRGYNDLHRRRRSRAEPSTSRLSPNRLMDHHKNLIRAALYCELLVFQFLQNSIDYNGVSINLHRRRQARVVRQL